MSEDRLEEIRQEKRERLQARAAGGSDPDPDDGAGAPAPDEPVPVRGADELEDLVASHDVALVDFYADWCGPCQMLAPIVERLAAETDAAVGKVDADANQRLASQHGVRGLPTLLLFADGEVVERLVGMQQESRLRQLVERHA